MKAVLTAVAVLVLAPAAAAAQPAFDQGSIIKVGHKHKHHGKGHGKHHRKHGGWNDRYDYDDRDDRRDERRAYREGYREGRRASAYDAYHPGYDQGRHRWARGDVLPYEYRRQPVYNYGDYGWGPPPRGHAYYRTSTGDIILAAIATGVIVHILTR